MITYRCAQPDEYREYLDLANTVFNQHGVPINFTTAIPKVYAPEMAEETASFQHVAIDEKGRFNALIAALPGQLHIEDQVLNYGYIGTVSVHPSCRGEGYMKHLMQDALVDMQTRQADFMILGGQRQRYQYFGYNKGGISWHVEISKRNIKHYLREVDASDIGFKPIYPGTEEEK